MSKKDEPRVYTKAFRTKQKFGPASTVRTVKITEAVKEEYEAISKVTPTNLEAENASQKFQRVQADLIDRLGEIRKFKRDLDDEDKAIREKLDWGNKSILNGDSFRAEKRQIKRRYQLKRVNGRPLVADWPKDLRDQILLPEEVKEVIYVLSKKDAN